MKAYLFSLVVASLALISQTVEAESLVTWSSPIKKVEKVIPYLSEKSYDDGYIYVTARISPSDKSPCVTPTNIDHQDNFFKEGQIEVVVSIVPEGFQLIDPKPVPIGTFQFKDSDKGYCFTPWTLPVVVAPTTRFGNDGSTGLPNPKLTLRLDYTSKDQNRVLPYAQSIIGVLSSVATGGGRNNSYWYKQDCVE